MKGISVITIDGPAGAGKSSVAKRLAKELKFSYLDTGAMYRALTFKAIRQKVDLSNEEALVKLAQNTKIDLEDRPEGLKVFLDGQDISRDIRTIEVTNNTFYAARAPRVREIMVRWQREIGSRKSVVVEGRDTGTVVFPQATCKFYLDANTDERARRRIKELKETGQPFDESKLKKEILDRDQKDMTRSVGPLKKADDAIYVDTTGMSIDQVVDKLLELMKSHG